MRAKSVLAVVGASACLATKAFAQSEVVTATAGSTSASWPVELSVMADSVGFVPGAPHPLLAVGTEIPWDNRGIFRIAQSVMFDYRLQPQFLHGPGVGTRLLLRWMANVGFFGEVGIGAGYSMAFLGPGAWVFDQASREFVPGGSGPRHMFKATVGLAVGLDFSVRWNVPLRATAGYDETIIFNVAPGAGSPIFPAPAWGVRLAWFLGGAK